MLANLDIDLVRRAWRSKIVSRIDQQAVIDQINEESGWSLRYAFMIAMSAGIAVLGLLLSSPAVVIGAMLISPLMNPILGFGFALATFDFSEARRSLIALAAGAVLAVAFTALIVLASPLKETTTEILARTRPNLFDLLVALFAALAGAYAIIKGRGGTIVGVAIATALMPPLATVGYGLATWNPPVLGGALALFVTNLVTIALSATIIARFYGFGHTLSSQQSWVQTGLLALVFVAVAVPLGLSLSRIAQESVAANQVRAVLSSQFGKAARVTQLAMDFDAKPVVVRAVLLSPRRLAVTDDMLRTQLQAKLGRPINLQLDRVLVDQNTNGLDAQRLQLRQAEDALAAGRTEQARVSAAIAVAAGVRADTVLVDSASHRASATAAALASANLETYRTLESRAARDLTGWRIELVPPFQEFPLVRFADGSDLLTPTGQAAVQISAWAARRWNMATLGVPGLETSDARPSARLTLSQRRAKAIADLLRAQGVSAVAERPSGREFRLTTVAAPSAL